MTDLADVAAPAAPATAWPSPTSALARHDLPPPPMEAAPAPSPAPGPAPAPAPAPAASPAPVSTNILAHDPAMVPAITIPAAPAARPPTPSALDTTALFTGEVGTPPSAARKKKGGGRRFVKMLVLLGLLGGLGYVGAVHGPDLYDEYVADDTEAEEAAPLAFPRTQATAPEIRTATFVLEGVNGDTAASYTVTVDFETRVSRVVIDRQDAPDLEVLTFSDDALIRRLDSDTWYKTERGKFPLQEQLRRADWIRQIDDLIPLDRRGDVIIDDATVSTVAGVQTRHLVVQLTSDLVRAAAIDNDAFLDPTREIEAAGSQTEPPDTPNATDAPVAPVTPVVEPEPPTVDRAPIGTDPVRIELWIDGQGIVRKTVGAPQFGAMTITIVSTSTDAWVPDYPDSALVQPMSAGALIDLGL